MTEEITQDEKLKVLRDSYLSRAQADADLGSQGRFKRETEARVTGTPTYPPQPPSSFWAKSLDEVSGTEPPFGVDINSVEPVGTPVEVAQSREKTVQPED